MRDNCETDGPHAHRAWVMFVEHQEGDGVVKR